MNFTISNIEQLDNEVLRDFNFDNGTFRTSELTFVESLQLPIDGKSVLELGSGPGFFTPYFTNKGCKTLSIEGREKNVAAFKIVNPNSDVLLLDLESEEWPTITPHNICFCFGLLYHLKDPESLIKKITPLVTDFLMLETCVTWHDEENLITNNTENSGCITQALNGVGCRPSRKKLWLTLKNYFPFVYTPLSQPQNSDFPTDSSTVVDNDGNIKRVIFICSNTDLQNPNLTLDFVDKYN
jgi:hypothetical protein